MSDHLIDGEFQSDIYPPTPRGKVPLSCKDPMAQDLLWRYAQRRRRVDEEFAADLEEALRLKGYKHSLGASPDNRRAQLAAQYLVVASLCETLADVHRDMARLHQMSSRMDEIVELCGKRSASFMEKLGNMLNAMDAADEADAWMDEIFEVAHQMWPVSD